MLKTLWTLFTEKHPRISAIIIMVPIVSGGMIVIWISIISFGHTV